jgi:hypothetical protein
VPSDRIIGVKRLFYLIFGTLLSVQAVSWGQAPVKQSPQKQDNSYQRLFSEYREMYGYVPWARVAANPEVAVRRRARQVADPPREFGRLHGAEAASYVSGWFRGCLSREYRRAVADKGKHAGDAYLGMYVGIMSRINIPLDGLRFETRYRQDLRYCE